MRTCKITRQFKGLKQLLPSLKVIRTQGAVPTNGRFTWRWGPQKGEVICGGSPHLSCKRDQIKMRNDMDRRVKPPKRVSSSTWGPPPLCKQALSHQPPFSSNFHSDHFIFLGLILHSRVLMHFFPYPLYGGLQTQL